MGSSLEEKVLNYLFRYSISSGVQIACDLCVDLDDLIPALLVLEKRGVIERNPDPWNDEHTPIHDIPWGLPRLHPEVMFKAAFQKLRALFPDRH